jgi:hypothetical protein
MVAYTSRSPLLESDQAERPRNASSTADPEINMGGGADKTDELEEAASD